MIYLQKNLRFLLKQNQVSYREVSKESGVSIKVISAIVNNSNLHVTLNSVVKLANYFKINLDDFVMKDLKKSTTWTSCLCKTEKMLLPIHPKHIEKIFEGTKQYEFRKVRCKDNVKSIIMYATAPQKQVVGEAEICEVLEGDLLSIWKETKEYAGISYDFFCSYYKDKKVAIAYKLTNVIIYENPLSLEDFGIKFAPQSFVYLK